VKTTIWCRIKRRVIYWFLGLLARLARWIPRLKLPGFIPLAGDIDGRVWAPAVDFRGGKHFGRSMTIPAILEIHIDGVQGTTSPAVLAPVARRLFPSYPPFVFNVSFACGRSPAFRPGVYADPRSPWFNVFVGYYQVDVPRSSWNRPFGYDLDGKLVIDDLARLGEADWNYFSNYMYGVPIEAIEPVDTPDARFEVCEPVVIGRRRWDHIQASGMNVVSPYLARGDGATLVDQHPILSDIWRCVFGEPFRGDHPATSFFATPMRAQFYVCFTSDDHDRDLQQPVYRTFIFGGTVNEWWAAQAAGRDAHNAAFLDLQMKTIEQLIIAEFPHLGSEIRTP
jgi:hypothetical protein